jgi:hypothetical protein
VRCSCLFEKVGESWSLKIAVPDMSHQFMN